MRRLSRILTFLLLCLNKPLGAQELSFLYGQTAALETQHSSYAWKIDYRQDLFRYGAWSASWINEGHVDGHRRDGPASQFWVQWPIFPARLTLALGAGAYRYFDTVAAGSGRGTLDEHGFAQAYSVSATYFTRSPFFFRITLDQIVAGGDGNTQLIQAGVGYRLWKISPDKKAEGANRAETVKTTTNELTISAGESIVNSFNDRHRNASGIEFRRGFAAHGDWSIAWLNQENLFSISRNGFAGEVWLVDHYLEHHLMIGIGTGPFFLLDPDKPSQTEENSLRDIAGIVTLTAAWRWNNHWVTRLNWDRVIRSSTHDADIFLLGMGYRWGRE